MMTNKTVPMGMGVILALIIRLHVFHGTFFLVQGHSRRRKKGGGVGMGLSREWEP